MPPTLSATEFDEGKVVSLNWEGSNLPGRYLFAKIGAGPMGCTLATANTDIVLGVLQNNPQIYAKSATGADQNPARPGAAAVMINGISMVQSSGTIAIGQFVIPAAGGQAAAASAYTSGALNASAKFVSGIALSAGAVNKLFTVLFRPLYFNLT